MERGPIYKSDDPLAMRLVKLMRGSHSSNECKPKALTCEYDCDSEDRGVIRVMTVSTSVLRPRPVGVKNLTVLRPAPRISNDHGPGRDVRLIPCAFGSFGVLRI